MKMAWATTLGVALTAGLMGTVGCRSDSGHAKDHSGKAMVAQSGGQLAGMLVDHHDGAICMAEIELQQGTRQDEKQMAQKMKDQRPRSA